MRKHKVERQTLSHKYDSRLVVEETNNEAPAINRIPPSSNESSLHGWRILSRCSDIVTPSRPGMHLGDYHGRFLG